MARHGPGIAEVVIESPPVNALPVQGWFALAPALADRGADPATRVVVLRAEGRGFCAGVDIKEMQDTEGFDALLGANAGCAAAFAAVYDCQVPVIAAVHGFCLGGGIGLAGNADIVLASDDAYVRAARGRQGCAGRGHASGPARAAAPDAAHGVHLANVTAAELYGFGSILRWSPAIDLRDAATRPATAIAAKDPQVIRVAKQSLNGIDPVDVKRSYRYEQGFTFELTLARRPGDKPARPSMGGSAMTPDEIVAG